MAIIFTHIFQKPSSLKKDKLRQWTKYRTVSVIIYVHISGEKVQAVEEMLKQTEEDADKEILEMKTSYEVDLKQEAESNVKLRYKTSK